MATIYVGPSSAGAANGTSWADRYGSLTAAEDKPVAAGDTVYVGPGVYRELLTVDVSGSGGSPITFVGDVTGEHTDGIGGIVRITGSDNDQSATRGSCITATAQRTYRTFRGFALDTTTAALINAVSCTNWIVEDCFFGERSSASSGVFISGASQAAMTVRRCCILTGGTAGVYITHSATLNDIAHLVENNLFLGNGLATRVERVGGATFKGNTVAFYGTGVRVVTALAVGQTITVLNNIFSHGSTAVQATVSGEITEDYNTFYGNGTDRSNVATGTNSVTYPAVFMPPLLLATFRFPWWAGELSPWSQVKRLAGSGMSSEDMFGITRPATASKKSWGALQFQDVSREVTTTRGSSAASLKLADAGEVHFIVPVTAVSTTISVYCYREADYAGTLPRLVIRQPGVADRTTTDTGSASTWNQISDTFTPDAGTDFVTVVLQSLNTATGNVDVFFDDLMVS